jgi:hypothetical protein
MSTRQGEINKVTGPVLWLIFLLSGSMLGGDIGTQVYRHFAPQQALVIMDWFTVAAIALQTVLFIVQGLRLRRLKQHLNDDREAILVQMKAEVERHFPDSPVQVARIMMDARRELFK